jgi:hypothetical protein
MWRAITMNAENRRMVTAAAVILTVVPFVLGERASAQGRSDRAEGVGRCKEVKGTWLDGVAGTTYTGQSGTVIKGGVLNGTTVVVYDPAFVVTPNPSFVAYISELTITTSNGQLRTNNVYLYDIVTNDLWTAIGYVNPNTSTGRFAGATGVLYFNGKTTGTYPLATYPSEITGQICFAGD